MVIKRDGKKVIFNPYNIQLAVKKAGGSDATQSLVSDAVTRECLPRDVSVEQIQDMVIRELMKLEPDVAERYILYREHRNKMRGRKQYDLFTDIIDVKGSNLARDNANMNAYTPSGMMYKFAAITSQQYAKDYLLSDETKQAVADNILHVHDLDYYPTKAVNCLQHPLDRLLKNGFRANHAANRPVQRIESAATMAAISLQTVQNEMFGGQAIPAFDFYLAPYVRKTYEEECEKLSIIPQKVSDYYAKSYDLRQTTAKQNTVARVHQAMEGFIHNMNDMHSRGGNQVVFSSINYGTDTSPEGRCLMKELLLATDEGVGNGETALFPIQIFKTKKGVNLNPEDPNYDLFQLSCRVTTKRFFPNFINLDATFNQHPAWEKDDPERYMYETATMGK